VAGIIIPHKQAGKGLQNHCPPHLPGIVAACATAGNLSRTINHRLLCNQHRAVEHAIKYCIQAVTLSLEEKTQLFYSKCLDGKMSANNSSNRINDRKTEYIVLPPAPQPAFFALKISFQLFYTTNK
jgi:hypothetical protein